MSVYSIDSVLIDFLDRRGYFNLRCYKSIALVGEENRMCKKLSMKYRLHHELYVDYKKIKVFTGSIPFTPDVTGIDLILGVRPCDAEKIILEYVTAHPKIKFAILPCTCYGYSKKIANYIREFPVITSVDCEPERFLNGTSGSTSWIILNNL